MSDSHVNCKCSQLEDIGTQPIMLNLLINQMFLPNPIRFSLFFHFFCNVLMNWICSLASLCTTRQKSISIECHLERQDSLSFSRLLTHSKPPFMKRYNLQTDNQSNRHTLVNWYVTITISTQNTAQRRSAVSQVNCVIPSLHE